MTIREYTLPEGPKLRHGKNFTSGGQQFPRNWLENADDASLAERGITVEVLPDPVKPPPTLDETKASAKTDVEDWEEEKKRQKFAATPEGLEGSKARTDIDGAVDEAAVQAILDSLT